MTTNIKQQEIRGELIKLNWSMADFVKEYDKHYKYKSKLTEESFKKQLSRKTTSSGLLDAYLDFIYSHREWLILGNIKPCYTSDEHFSAEFNERMKGISKLISDKVEKNL